MPVTGVVPSREDESTQAKTNHFGQTQVPEGLTDVIAIAAGIQHSLAVKSDGTVIACGQNDAGQINVPTRRLNVVTAVAASQMQSSALNHDGTVVAWSNNYALDDSDLGVPVGLADATAIAAGRAFGLALRADGRVAAWGANKIGQTDGQYPALGECKGPEATRRPLVTLDAPDHDRAFTRLG